MANLVVHNRTQQALNTLYTQPPHAIVLVGATGSGKESLAKLLTSQLLDIELSELAAHPYVAITGAEEGAISIDQVRDVQHFLSRKTTSTHTINRVAIVVKAERMTREAQNAFLKTLEEPPAGSVIIMTVQDEQELLPTVLSRVQTVQIYPPDTITLHEYFTAAGKSTLEIDRAILISGGLPGLMSELIAGNAEHPLVKAAELARNILRLDTFGRLALVDGLSKQRKTCQDVLFILQQMATVSLRDTSKAVTAQKQWRNILQQAYAARQALDVNAQPKLVLTHLMLSL
jgi:replication-associated recombination protein RarA